LISYLAFFVLQETNTVTEKLEVFLCSLAGELCCDELLVKGCVVIILVWSQVHFFILLLIVHLVFLVVTVLGHSVVHAISVALAVFNLLLHVVSLRLLHYQATVLCSKI
jgi:hypothetical protein